MIKVNHKVIVSVIIPNYNHKEYLSQRINSVMEQTFIDYEVILLDDHSTDNSQEILSSYQDNPHISHIILNPENSGSPFHQWEKGIKLAKGKYIWIAESDDYASPLFLEYAVNALEAHPKASLCYTGSHIIDGAGEPIKIEGFDKWEEDGLSYVFNSHEYIKSHLLHHNSIYNASMVLFKKEGCLSAITSEYKKMHYAGDWLFWIEQCRKGDVIEVRKKLNYFRKHNTNTTLKGDENGNAIIEISIIKGFLYKNIQLSWVEKIIDKSSFYRHIKYYPVSKQRRKELYKIASRQANITFFSYVIGQRVKSYMKHHNKNQ
ncbi:glycosyltransferase family 2 protein [Bacteroides sp.]|uniref:glycosyltransferase family 2 protein n=1 Tax=Bacteroides sp. TaxID=29523 RepID=UPI0025B92AFE|nr:glycosyltransferase family 2 protein [Bacteroides sp.]